MLSHKYRRPDNNYVYRIVEKAIDLYNRYHAPEAIAELIDLKSKEDEVEVIIKFTGSFCSTCGVRDWVEDYIYVLDMIGCKAELKEYIEPEDNEDYRIGVFKLELKKRKEDTSYD